MVQAANDVGSDQPGSCGFGEKWSDSGSILKVESSGFPHKTRYGGELQKERNFCCCYLLSKCGIGTPGVEQVGWEGVLNGILGSGVRRVQAWRRHFGAHWLAGVSSEKQV